ncbi:hypothetical protein ACP70R_025116 [Stipagrostis hirtigluma subsp. patula]
MANEVPMSPELEQVDDEIQDIFHALHRKIDKIKDANRQSKQLEDLTAKTRECKRLIKESTRGVASTPGADRRCLMGSDLSYLYTSCPCREAAGSVALAATRGDCCA